MGGFQFFVSLISFLIGVFTFMISKSAIHETFAMTFFIVSAILFAGASITNALNRVIDHLKTIVGSPALSPKRTPDETLVEKTTEAVSSQFAQHSTETRPAAKPSWVEQAKKELKSESHPT